MCKNPSENNRLATSISVIEGRRKKSVHYSPGISSFFLRGRKRKTKTKQSKTKQEPVRIGAGYTRYLLQNPRWGCFPFLFETVLLMLTCECLHFKTHLLAFLLETQLSASLSTIQFTGPRWTNSRVQILWCIIPVSHYSLSLHWLGDFDQGMGCRWKVFGIYKNEEHQRDINKSFGHGHGLQSG